MEPWCGPLVKFWTHQRSCVSILGMRLNTTWVVCLVLFGYTLNSFAIAFNLCRSFNDKPINEAVVGPIGKELFEKEQNDLITDLMTIPKKACDRKAWFRRVTNKDLFSNKKHGRLFCRLMSFSFIVFKINEFVKRARAATINAYIMSHLKKEMPAMMGKSKAQQRLMDNLQQEFEKVSTI